MYRQNSFDNSIDSELKRGRKSQLISFAVLAILIIVYSIWRSQGVESLKMQWTDKTLNITDPSGDTYSLQLAEIGHISYHPDWDFGTCSESREDKFYRYGVCENETVGSYHIYSSKNCSSAILIETETEKVAISYESDEITKKLYEALSQSFEELGFSPDFDL